MMNSHLSHRIFISHRSRPSAKIWQKGRETA